MPTGVRVGSSVACYEFICRMAQITAESQPPTLSVCLRAKGDLWVCFCLHFCYYDNTSISIHIYRVYQCLLNSRYLLFPFTLNFCAFSSCRSHLVLLVLFFLYYPPPPHHPMLTSNSRDAFGYLCPTFPTSPTGKATVWSPQGLFSSNYMLMIIKLFKAGWKPTLL